MYANWRNNSLCDREKLLDKFNGKWKLTHSENHIEFYESIDTPQKDIETNKFVDNPANDVADEFIINGEHVEKRFYISGVQVHTMQFQLGELRDVEYDGGQFTVVTRMEGNKMVDIINRKGLKEARYEKSIDGDKLIIDMVNAEDNIRGRIEFTRTV